MIVPFAVQEADATTYTRTEFSFLQLANVVLPESQYRLAASVVGIRSR
jgi:hypothetical protein